MKLFNVFIREYQIVRFSILMEKSKAFRTEVRCGNDYNDIPSLVEFCIDEATAADIIRLAGIVTANGLYKVEKFEYRAKYLKYDPEQDPEEAKLAGEESEFRTEADVLATRSSGSRATLSTPISKS